jgi:DNA-binding CsgD family transcriptional regulator
LQIEELRALRDYFAACASPLSTTDAQKVCAVARERYVIEYGRGRPLDRLILAIDVTANLTRAQEAAGRQVDADLVIRSVDAEVTSRLRKRFGLTPTQANLAIALAHGTPLKEIADSRAVKISTLRSHIKALCTKMRCERQAEIVAVVLSFPPVVAIKDGVA